MSESTPIYEQTVTALGFRPLSDDKWDASPGLQLEEISWENVWRVFDGGTVTSKGVQPFLTPRPDNPGVWPTDEDLVVFDTPSPLTFQ